MNHRVVEDEMEELASLYALGALSQHEARAFDEHLAEGCEPCKERLSGFESVVANLAYDPAEASPSAVLRDKLMARLYSEQSHTASEPILEYNDSRPLLVRAGEGSWQTMSEGVLFKQLFMDTTRNTVTSLVKMQPGARVPMHRHHGIEECYVIEGDIFANDETLNAGDYTCAFAGSIHLPISTSNGALLLIVAPESFEALGQ